MNFQKSLLTKIHKMLFEKIEEIQTDIIVHKYGLPSRECLKDLVKMHDLQFEEAKLRHNIEKLFPDNTHGSANARNSQRQASSFFSSTASSIVNSQQQNATIQSIAGVSRSNRPDF